MLNLRNNIFKLFVVSLFLNSCEFENKDIAKYEKFKKESKMKFPLYKKKYDDVNDTIQSWVNQNLSYTKFLYLNNWQIDSTFLFNNDSTKFYTIILCNSNAKNSIQDDIHELGGVKINGKWYLLLGATWAIERSYYQDSIYSTLSFEELQYVAYENAFKKFSNNKFALSNQFFNYTFFDYACKFNGNYEHCCDSLIIATTKNIHHTVIGQEELNEIKSYIFESLQPINPVISSWDRLFKENKIFETSAWKNRDK